MELLEDTHNALGLPNANDRGRLNSNNSITVAKLLNGVKKTNSNEEILQYSKVIDANGEPKVVYHGTTQGGFYIFNPALGQELSQSAAPSDKYSFFTDDKTIADGYALYYRAGKDDPDPHRPLKAEEEDYEIVEEILYQHIERGGKLQKVQTGKRYGVQINGQWIPDSFGETPEVAKSKFDRHLQSVGYNEKSMIYEVFLNLRSPELIDAENNTYETGKCTVYQNGVTHWVFELKDPKSENFEFVKIYIGVLIEDMC